MQLDVVYTFPSALFCFKNNNLSSSFFTVFVCLRTRPPSFSFLSRSLRNIFGGSFNCFCCYWIGERKRTNQFENEAENLFISFRRNFDFERTRRRMKFVKISGWYRVDCLLIFITFSISYQGLSFMKFMSLEWIKLGLSLRLGCFVLWCFLAFTTFITRLSFLLFCKSKTTSRTILLGCYRRQTNGKEISQLVLFI